MAQAPVTLSGQRVKTVRTSAARKTAPSGQSSFASVMAREQAGAAGGATDNLAGKRTRPVVAKLPNEDARLTRDAILAGRSPSELLQTRNFGMAAASVRRDTSGLRTIAANNNGQGFPLSSNDFIRTSNRAANVAKSGGARRAKKTNAAAKEYTGKLSAKFESGSEGIAAIGYDGVGGTSYGKYQIASKVGSMKNFLTFLDNEAPDLSSRLRSAGPANTGSRRGAMPDEWRAIAAEQPERFERLQESFIRQSHYEPALAAIDARTGLDAATLSPAMREVIWSAAVQHGPTGAARIFAKADEMSGSPKNSAYERNMITNVYKLRAGQFGSSTSQVRDSVRSRFLEEKELALSMLNETKTRKT